MAIRTTPTSAPQHPSSVPHSPSISPQHPSIAPHEPSMVPYNPSMRPFKGLSSTPHKPSMGPHTPSSIPVMTPTVEKTPSSSPITSPTSLHAANLRGVDPTLRQVDDSNLADDDITPSLSPDPQRFDSEISKIIQREYDTHESFLKNSEVGEHLRSFIVIENPTKVQMTMLLRELSDDRGLFDPDGRLGDKKMWAVVKKIDHDLKIAIKNYDKNHYKNVHTDEEGGIYHGVTVSSAREAGNIADVIEHKDKDFSDLMQGNQLAGSTILDITPDREHAGVKIGFTSLVARVFDGAFKKTIVINECDESNKVIGVIYAATATPSVHALNGADVCHDWAAKHYGDFIITNSGSAGCNQYDDIDSVLKACHDYVLVHDEL